MATYMVSAPRVSLVGFTIASTDGVKAKPKPLGMATNMVSAPRVSLAGFARASTDGVKAKPSPHHILPPHHMLPFNRSSFPDRFIFGAGSAAYQVHQIASTYIESFCNLVICLISGFLYQTEGAARMHNRGPSIWDTFTIQQPGFYLFFPNSLLQGN